MKICFIADSYPCFDRFGGIGQYTHTAAQALAKMGHEVHVLVYRTGDHRDLNDGPVFVHIRPVRCLPVLGRWLAGLGESFGVAWWLSKLHRRYRFDIVEAPNWEGIGLASVLLRVAPVVVRVHTGMSDSIAAAKRQPKRGERFMMWAERTSVLRARSVVTHSDNSRKGCPRPNIHVIPHGIVLPPRPSPESALAVLSVGQLNARKGGPTLLAAIPQVLQQVPNAEFWLAGPDENDPLAKNFHATHPDISSRQVQFLGFIKGERLHELYAQCAIYASASNYESFGLTFVEAMAHGKAVIGCAVSAMPEIIEPEKNGLLVPPGDATALAAAMIRLLRDTALRTRLGQTARQTAEGKYSDQIMARKMAAYYQAVIDDRPPGK